MRRSLIAVVGLVSVLAIAGTAQVAQAALIPPATASMLAWYKADAGLTLKGSATVTGWADQSGNGYNLTSAGGLADANPKLVNVNFGPYASGTMPTIDFSPSSYKLVSAALTGQTVGTVLVMLKPSTTVTSTTATQTLLSFSSNSATNKAVAIGSFTSDLTNEYLTVRSGLSTTVSGAVGTSGSVPFGNTILASRFNSSTSHWNIYLGTGTALNQVDNGYGSAQTLISPEVIGVGYNWGPNWKGQVAEILIYKTALSDTDLAAAQTYLSTKYGYTPEPATMAMLALGGLALLRRRKV